MSKRADVGHLSNEAANYDAKHERATEEIARRIEARRDFIGLEWVEDDDSSEDEDDDTDGQPSGTVKILDYACGTGSMSRVSLLPLSIAGLVWMVAPLFFRLTLLQSLIGLLLRPG